MPARIRDRAVVLNIADDLAGVVSDLDAPVVAWIVQVPDDLAVGVGDVAARRGVGLAIAHDARGRRGRGGQDRYGQGCQD